jgi:acetyl-CoA carboxylase carboxyl transferase subunit alpha
MTTLLEFEQPIAALEAKIAEMKRLAEENQVDVSDAVQQLEGSLHELKLETAANLTRWQRVQLSRHPDRPYTLDYMMPFATIS